MGKGDANSTENVVEMGDGVGGKVGADVSVNESEMPPNSTYNEVLIRSLDARVLNVSVIVLFS